jgi:maleylacetoacetate isomerase
VASRGNLENITLYHYWRSSSSWRVRWALELKRIKAKMVAVDLLNGESEASSHARRHPMGYVPVLDVNGKFLIQSVAIIEWLEEIVPSPQLYPGDSFQRAHIRSLVEIINADTQPIQNVPVGEKYSDDPDKRIEWNRYFIRRGLEAFEHQVSKSAGRFCVGDTITAADLFLVPQCYNAERFKAEIADLKHVSAIYRAALQTAEAKASAPDKYVPSK